MIKMIEKYFTMFKFMKKKKEFYLLIIFSIIGALFSIAPIIVLEKIINIAILKNNKEISFVLILGFIYLAMQVISAFSEAVSSYLSESIQKSICSELQKTIYDKLCIVDYVELRNNDTLMFTNSLIEDTNNIAENYMLPISQLIIAIVSFVLALIYMLSVDVLLTVVLFPLVLITTLSSRYIQKKLSEQILIKREKNEKLWKLLSELIKGISSIRLLKRQKHFKTEMNESIESSKISGIEQAKIESMNIFIMTTLFMATIGGILIITSIFLIENKITIGTLVAILMYNHMLVDPLLELVDIQAEINKVYISISKLNLILSLNDYELGICSSVKPIRLEVNDVEFFYPNQEEKFFYKISINLKENYAIVGETGIGKSTIAKILSGLNRFEKGTITYYGENKEEIVFPKIAYHEQDGYVFDKSLKENILFGNMKITDDEYKKILRICCLENLVENFGNAALGENGSRLSGGERKRILIARTLSYTDAEIFIFDEICSSLDSTTIRNILDNLLKAYGEKSFIFIEHNPIISEYVDKVIKMDKRRIVYENI